MFYPMYPPTPQHGIQLAQQAWLCESMGQVPQACALYQQSLQYLGLPGLPEPVQAWWLAFVPMRLAYLNHAVGQAAWAQGWLQHALPALVNLQRWQPQDPALQQTIAQVRAALGPPPLPGMQPRHQGMQPIGYSDAGPGAVEAGKSDGMRLLEKGLEVLPKVFDFLKTFSSNSADQCALPGGWDVAGSMY